MVANEQPRYAEKFTNGAGTLVCEFPLAVYEYKATQAYRVATAPVVGSDYDYDFLGSAPWVKGKAVEAVRFVMAGQSAGDLSRLWDELHAIARNGGLGKLWTVDRLGSRRWAWAKLSGRPGYTSAVSVWGRIPTEFIFDRFSDWRGETQTVVTHTETGGAAPFVVTNAGNAPTDLVRIQVQTNNAVMPGFTNPALVNVTNGYEWSSTRDAGSATAELDVDSGLWRVRYSNDGVSYADDLALFTFPNDQGAFFRLEPGANICQYTGTINGDLDCDFVFTFWPTYH